MFFINSLQNNRNSKNNLGVGPTCTTIDQFEKIKPNIIKNPKFIDQTRQVELKDVN